MALSIKQIEAIELLAPGNMLCQDVATRIDVAPATISRWRSDPEFTEAVVQRAREIIRHELPSVYCVLVQKAKEGSVAHIRVLLEHLEAVEMLNASAMKGNISFAWMADE